MSLEFYKQLPAYMKSVSEILQDETHFVSLPYDWDIIVTDVAGSTKAIDEGKYREVNLAAASCIIAGLNIAREYKTDIPFVFGGDGATLLCPPDITTHIMKDLQRIQTNAAKNFDLTLRVGFVPISSLHGTQGVKLAKIQVAKGYPQAIFLGKALAEAEKKIKADLEDSCAMDTQDPNLKGLQCRWREIDTPENHTEVVSLIVEPTGDNPEKTIRNVLSYIDRMYGNEKERHPVSKEHLSIIKSYKEIKRELRMKYSSPPMLTVVRTMFDVILASIVFKFSILTRMFDPALYTRQLIAATDTLKIDGSLKTTFSGSSEKREKLIKILDMLEENGALQYGLHVTDQSVLTCYVAHRDAGHIHFLDAKHGGYTQAAKMMKEKAMTERSRSREGEDPLKKKEVAVV